MPRTRRIVAADVPPLPQNRLLAQRTLAPGDIVTQARVTVNLAEQPLAWLAQALPSTAGVQVLVKANQMQASLADVAPELATLALLALGYGALAAHRLLRRRPCDFDASRVGVSV